MLTIYRIPAIKVFKARGNLIKAIMMGIENITKDGFGRLVRRILWDILNGDLLIRLVLCQNLVVHRHSCKK
jgi:hypothetical protein